MNNEINVKKMVVEKCVEVVVGVGVMAVMVAVMVVAAKVIPELKKEIDDLRHTV